MPTVFIGGTDTEVGKTWVTVRLLRSLRAQGLDAVGFKPVAAGCEKTAAGWRNDDALALQEAGTPGPGYDSINPYALPEPIAPHIAAANAGQRIDGERIITAARALAAAHDWVLIEGAGGLCVPLNESEDFLGLVARAGWPTLLVVGMRLGCINHARLSGLALQQAGVPWGWVANRLPPPQPALEENLRCLQQQMAGPELRWQDEAPLAAFPDWYQSLNLAANRRFD